MAVKIAKEREYYRHFKGTVYYVHCISQHTETNELLVNYQKAEDIYGLTELVGIVWTRPLQNFCSDVEVDGNLVPRFCLIQS